MSESKLPVDIAWGPMFCTSNTNELASKHFKEFAISKRGSVASSDVPISLYCTPIASVFVYMYGDEIHTFHLEVFQSTLDSMASCLTVKDLGSDSLKEIFMTEDRSEAMRLLAYKLDTICAGVGVDYKTSKHQNIVAVRARLNELMD
jgi:hypothetical protein